MITQLNKELNKENRFFGPLLTRNFLVKKYRGTQFCVQCSGDVFFFFLIDFHGLILSALWRPLGEVSGAPLGHLGSFRGIEKGQDGARRSRKHFRCQLGSNLDYPLGRAKRASERSARSAGMQCQADRGDAIE